MPFDSRIVIRDATLADADALAALSGQLGYTTEAELLRQRLTIAAEVGESLQIVAGWKADHLARRCAAQVPEICFETVGVETERQFAAAFIAVNKIAGGMKLGF